MAPLPKVILVVYIHVHYSIYVIISLYLKAISCMPMRTCASMHAFPYLSLKRESYRQRECVQGGKNNDVLKEDGGFLFKNVLSVKLGIENGRTLHFVYCTILTEQVLQNVQNILITVYDRIVPCSFLTHS
jgi:hypothetical protein